ncbi:MAG TPA: FecR domain-containing protein [Polyangiaceae bacterium]|jgi:hypothetical protein|nr:FecR domain-containing protein [Polyangiaceae bacterium]
MRELEELGREVRQQLGEPSPSWLRAQRNELRRAFTPQSDSRFFRLRLVSAAAVLLAVALGTLAWFRYPIARQVVPSQSEMVLNAPSGERRVELADGSSLVLSPLSLGRVSAGADGTRCVVEVGTLRFNVAPQKGRQFLVVAGAFEIRVVGTRFTVRRDAAGVVEVNVEHGVVRVRAPNRNTPIELEAGDRLRGDENGLSLTHPAPAASGASVAVRADAARADTPASEAEARPGEVTARALNSAAPRLDWQALYRERNYTAALAAAKQQGLGRLLETLAAQPLSELADAARLGGDSELSLRVFANIERRFPGSAQAQDAAFLSGRIHAARGQVDAAQAKFEKYLSLSARGAYSLEATGRLVELYAARGDGRAKAAARTYLERAPNGPYQRLCRSVLANP